MTQSKYIFILLLLLQSIFASLPVAANQLVGRDISVFHQATMAMDEKNWQLAQSLLSGLYNQFPENIVIRNNLAVAFFNLGELEKSQNLFSSIIEQNNLTATAYKNLKTLYSYSAAKTYSKGLNLMKPIELPKLLVLNQQLNENSIAVNRPVKVVPGVLSSVAVNSDELSSEKLALQKTLIEKPSFEEKESTNISDVNRLNKLVLNNSAPVNKTKNSQPILKSVKTNSKSVKTKQKNEKKVLQSELLARLEQWRKAWVSGNSKNYIAMYKGNYSPRGKNRKSWVKNRREKVNINKKINVLIKHPKVFVDKAIRRANIRFNQHYSSKNYSDQVVKRLYWVKEQGQWFIEKESIIKIM
jgi:Tetratricopeptide repeat